MLAGRGSEIERLHAALADAVHRRGRAVVVRGVAGVGKSALVETFSAEVRRSGGVVNAARCVEIGGAPAFWPWIQLLRSMRAGDRDVPTFAGSILLGDRSAATALDSDEDRFRLFDDVSRLLDSGVDAEPTVLVIEDCHAADLASLHLLRFVAAHASGVAPYLLVATVRDGELEPGSDRATLLSEIVAAAATVELVGLDAGAVAEIIRQTTSSRAEQTIVDAAHDATAGNPLFLHALLRHLESAGGIERLTSSTTVPVPATVRDVFAARLARLSPEIESDLALLAAAGREVEPHLARELLGSSLDDVVERGLRDGILERPGPFTPIRFVHSLAQASILDRVPTGARPALHRRVAGELERVHDEDRDAALARLAHHWALAGPEHAGAAYQYARLAGDRAKAVGGHGDAIEHYQRALDLAAAAGVPDVERSELLTAVGDARIRSGDVEGGRQACRDAWDLARRRGAGDAMATAALCFGRVPEGGLTNEELVRQLTGALDALPETSRGLRARLRARLAAELSFDDDDRREALARDAVDEARATGDPSVVAEVLRFAQSAVASPHNLDDCLRWTSEAIGAVEQVDDLGGKAELVAYRSVHHMVAGDVDRYETDTSTLVQLARHVPTPLNEWNVAVATAYRALLQARFEDAAEDIDRSVAFADRIPNALASWQLQQFALAWERGTVATMEPVLVALPRLGPGFGPMARAALAFVHASTGRTSEALAALPQVADEVLAKRTPWSWLLSVGWLAECCAIVADRLVAPALTSALAPFEQLHVVGATGSVASYWGTVHRHLGRLALVTGDAERAVSHADAALAAHTRVGALTFVVRSTLDLAVALANRDDPGDTDRAAALLTEARDGAARLGLAGVAADVEAASTAMAAPPAEEARQVTRALLTREGEYWSVTHRANVVRLRDVRGLHYLAALLRHPGRELHALDVAGPRDTARRSDDVGADVLDEQARRAYQQRLEDLAEELADAERNADLGRASRLREEWDLLVDELTKATGLGGRSRTLGTPPSEAARIAVTKAIRGVLKRIEAGDAELGRHLNATIRTGTFCSYRADLDPSIRCEVDVP